MNPAVLIPHDIYESFLQRHMDKTRRYELAVSMCAEGIVVTAIDIGFAEKMIKLTVAKEKADYSNE